MKKKTWIAAIAAVLVIGISGMLYVSSRPQPTDKKAQTTINSALKFKAAREDLTNIVEVKGKSSYQKETYVNAPFGADVKAWSVKDGTQVASGDVLFQLDDTSLRDEIAQLEAAGKKLDMDIRLSQFQGTAANTEAGPVGAVVTEAGAKQRFAQEESRRMQEEINGLSLNHNRTQQTEKAGKLQQAQFTAPENGIFLFEGTKEPQSVKENERIGKIVDLTKLQMISIVGEYDLFKIKEGMAVDVRIDALKNEKLEGKVERLSKFAKTKESDKENTNTAAEFEVVVSLTPNEKLIAGLSLTASIQTDKKEGALVVPTLAIQREKDEYYVMVETEQDALERRVVKLGLETPEKTEIVNGLNEGETVVLQ